MIALLAMVALLTTTALAPLSANPRSAALRDTPPGEILGLAHEGTFSIPMVLEETVQLFEPFGLPEARYPVDRYLVRFRSTDVDGSPAVIRGQLYVPRLSGATSLQGVTGPQGATTELPVIVFAAGTTGIGEQCAPILEVPAVNRWGWYLANMLAYASQGYIVLFPEYLGFGDRHTPQRYFDSVAEAHVMLDAIRAVYRIFEQPDRLAYSGVRPSQMVFAAGYSQGGHAAHAAADLRPSYAPEVPLTGLIGFGQTNNVATLMREMAYYAPYIIYAYSRIHGADQINPADFLQERWMVTFEQDIYGLCVEEFQFHYPRDGAELFTPEFWRALTIGGMEERFPVMARVLAENYAGMSGHGIPTLVLHGDADIIVSTAAQTRFVQDLCDTGVPVEFVIMPGARHRDTRPAGFKRSVEWMRLIERGESPPNHCPAR